MKNNKLITLKNMNRSIQAAVLIFFLSACAYKVPTISPTESAITESIYASGIVKSENQYSVFAKVNGIVEHVYVESGDYVIKGSPILSIYNETQRLTNEKRNVFNVSNNA